MDVVDEREEQEVVEVVSPDGYVVRVPQDAATENVRRVLQVLHDAR
jgi:hypothetical protein